MSKIVVGQTKFSRLLWAALAKRGIDSITEYPDGHKTIDIAILPAHLYIEVDGVQHLNNPEQIITDFKRDYYSSEGGFYTLHIHNDDIKNHLNSIADAIEDVVKNKQMPILKPVIDLTDNILKNTRALIWKREGGKIFFLLTQEPSGSFTIPGGCKDLGDVDLPSALRRELQEELGLKPEDYSMANTDIQKEYENLYKDPQSERFEKKTIIYIFIVSDLKKEPIPSSEIKSISWLTKEDALAAFSAPHMKELFQLVVDKI
jgi:very-short-patch-repair endonuclease/8-oxo-dGTP pyrophosphatase MutT (NUDIX family)